MRYKFRYSKINKGYGDLLLLDRSALQELQKGVLQVEMKETLDNNQKPYEEIQISRKGEFMDNYKSQNIYLWFVTTLFVFYMTRK